jgi:hypothetical protein
MSHAAERVAHRSGIQFAVVLVAAGAVAVAGWSATARPNLTHWSASARTSESSAGIPPKARVRTEQWASPVGRS